MNGAEVPSRVIMGRAKLVIVYHRQPFDEVETAQGIEYREHKSPNGIIPSLRGVCRSLDNPDEAMWVAWSRCTPDSAGHLFEPIVVPTPEGPLNIQRVGLTPEQVTSFYYVTSKAALWPILHSFPERFDYDAAEWETFREVNRIFAEGVCACAAPGAVVWIHDYNLWLVPGFVRAQRPDLKIAFFLHTPFPGPDVFGILPWRVEILQSLLSCDRLGFHIPRYSQNFVTCARALCGAKASHRVSASDLLSQEGSVLHEPQFVTELELGGQKTHIDAIPLGINAPLIHQIRERVATRKRTAQIREELAVETVILSVGRVDYTKGVVELLQAFERLLARRAELSGRVKLVLTCVPPASGIEVYEDIQRDIEQRVGAINGRYSTLTWTPILLFTQPFRFDELVAWYGAADICWVTPLRDGLNLVAKEFVVAKGGKAGVLVLSDFAGSVIELDEAIHCNPYSSRNMDASLDKALSTPFEQAAHDSHLMFRRVCRNSIGHWTSEMMRRLGLAVAKRPAA